MNQQNCSLDKFWELKPLIRIFFSQKKEIQAENVICLNKVFYYDSFSEQTACCYMFVEGNPAPTFRFYKVGPYNCVEIPKRQE